MLSHILYGTATLAYGGLTLTARGPGLRGSQVTLEVRSGTPLAVTVVQLGIGTGSITVTAPAGTTEAALATALKAAPNFKALARVEQTTGLGTATISIPFAKTPFVLANGLQQWLEQRIGIQGWDDRDMLATGRPVGLIMPLSGKQDRVHYEFDGVDYLTGMVLVGIALQMDRPFHEGNAALDMYRRALYVAVKTFSHPDLMTTGDVEWTISNILKDEAAGTVLEEARLKTQLLMPWQWQEASFDAEDEVGDGVIHELSIGLWREPLDDPLGPGGLEDLDTRLNIQLTE